MNSNLHAYRLCVLCATENQKCWGSGKSLYQQSILPIWWITQGSDRQQHRIPKKLINDVCAQLGVEHKIYSPPYRPQSNGRIESFHYFLKACISKHVTPQVEWNDVIPLACAVYNFLPNEHSKESPFFLMFGRDVILPLNTLI